MLHLGFFQVEFLLVGAKFLASSPMEFVELFEAMLREKRKDVKR